MIVKYIRKNLVPTYVIGIMVITRLDGHGEQVRIKSDIYTFFHWYKAQLSILFINS